MKRIDLHYYTHNAQGRYSPCVNRNRTRGKNNVVKNFLKFFVLQYFSKKWNKKFFAQVLRTEQGISTTSVTFMC